MPDFTVFVSSNNPKLKDAVGARSVLRRFAVDREMNFGVQVHRVSGEPYLVFWGYDWPEAWRLPEGVKADEFDPYCDEATYARGREDFNHLLQALAPFLADPFTIHAVANTGALFPFAACEWHIEPGTTTVEVTAFRHGQSENG